jgi:hypothetical protein
LNDRVRPRMAALPIADLIFFAVDLAVTLDRPGADPAASPAASASLQP